VTRLVGGTAPDSGMTTPRARRQRLVQAVRLTASRKVVKIATLRVLADRRGRHCPIGQDRDLVREDAADECAEGGPPSTTDH
jgi:hypothetical protein